MSVERTHRPAPAARHVGIARFARMLLVVWSAWGLFAGTCRADASDVPFVSSDARCSGDDGSAGPLTLEQAILRAACFNPRSRQSRADIEAHTASVGVAQGAFLPTLSGNAQGGYEKSATNIRDQPDLSSRTDSSTHSRGLTLNWVAYDFGARQAALRGAELELDATRSTHVALVYEEVKTVTREWYAAQLARALRDVAQEEVALARSSLDVAQGRVRHGAAPVTDRLRASTRHVEAVMELASAEGDVRAADGALATEMGYGPARVLVLPALSERERTASALGLAIQSVIDEAQSQYPAVVAARQRALALDQNVEKIRAQGLPTLGLVGRLNGSSQPTSISYGSPPLPSKRRESYAGIQLNIPFFEGFVRQHQVEEAQAQARRQLEVLEEARAKSGLDAWRAYHQLDVAAQNLARSDQLVGIADENFTASKERYRSGVGSIVELVDAQKSLMEAKKKRFKNLSDWDRSQSELLLDMGRLPPAGT